MIHASWRLALASTSLGVLLVALLASGCGLDREGTANTGGTTGQGGTGLVGGTGGTGAQAAAGGHAATGGTGAQAGSGAAAGTGGTGGVGGSVVEDCLDGIDNDNNGQTDCDDAQCTAFDCLPDVPGSLGRVALLDPAECLAPAGMSALSSCDDCSCGAGSEGSCSIDVEMHDNSSCTNEVNNWQTEGCRNVYDATRWFIGTTSPNGDGYCWPDSLQVTAQTQDVCLLPMEGTCGGGQACVPAAFAAEIPTCVLLDGVADCVAPYEQRRIVYQGASNQCACNCIKGSQSCASVTLTVSSNDWNCGGNTTQVPVDGSCQQAGQTDSVYIPDVPSALECTPLAILNGSFTLRTLCCTPP